MQIDYKFLIILISFSSFANYDVDSLKNELGGLKLNFENLEVNYLESSYVKTNGEKKVFADESEIKDLKVLFGENKSSEVEEIQNKININKTLKKRSR